MIFISLWWLVQSSTNTARIVHFGGSGSIFSPRFCSKAVRGEWLHWNAIHLGLALKASLAHLVSFFWDATRTHAHRGLAACHLPLLVTATRRFSDSSCRTWMIKPLKMCPDPCQKLNLGSLYMGSCMNWPWFGKSVFVLVHRKGT